MLELYPISAPAFAVGQSFYEVLRFGAQHGEYPGVSSQGGDQPGSSSGGPSVSAAMPLTPAKAASADGRWVLVSHRRFPSGDYVSIRTDITAQKQRESELANLLRELTEAQAATEKATDEIAGGAWLKTCCAPSPTQCRRWSPMSTAKSAIAVQRRVSRHPWCRAREPARPAYRRRGRVGDLRLVMKPQIERVLAGTEVAFVRPDAGPRRDPLRRAAPYVPKASARRGSIDGFYAIAWDITDSQIREQALSREAQTDPLTGLLNRTRRDRRPDRARCGTGGLGESQGAVLFLQTSTASSTSTTRWSHDIGDDLLENPSPRACAAWCARPTSSAGSAATSSSS